MKLEKWTSGTGQKLLVHAREKCDGQHCVVHNPSDHPMRDFPTYWRPDRGITERICPHGIGHPDPDDMAFIARVRGQKAAHLESIHGCDGCCAGVHYPERPKE